MSSSRQLLSVLDDFSMWKASRYRTNRPHVRAYYKIAEMTEPAEDQEDRYTLYAM
jgi:hypothetical protein